MHESLSNGNKSEHVGGSCCKGSEGSLLGVNKRGGDNDQKEESNGLLVMDLVHQISDWESDFNKIIKHTKSEQYNILPENMENVLPSMKANYNDEDDEEAKNICGAVNDHDKSDIEAIKSSNGQFEERRDDWNQERVCDYGMGIVDQLQCSEEEGNQQLSISGGNHREEVCNMINNKLRTNNEQTSNDQIINDKIRNAKMEEKEVLVKINALVGHRTNSEHRTSQLTSSFESSENKDEQNILLQCSEKLTMNMINTNPPTAKDSPYNNFNLPETYNNIIRPQIISESLNKRKLELSFNKETSEIVSFTHGTNELTNKQEHLSNLPNNSESVEVKYRTGLNIQRRNNDQNDFQFVDEANFEDILITQVNQSKSNSTN